MRKVSFLFGFTRGVISFFGEFLLLVGRSSVTAKIASEGKAVKGLSRHKRSYPAPNGHLFHVPLTALPSCAFGGLTNDHPKPLFSPVHCREP